MDGPDRLFVYGTLKPGEPLWPTLAPYAVAWEEVLAEGRLWDTGLGYPAVRFGAGRGAVPGVLVTVHPDRAGEAIAVLDEVEDEGHLYRRIVVTTTAGEAFAYEWLGSTDGLEPLLDGWPPVP